MDAFIQMRPIERVRAVKQICAAMLTFERPDVTLFFARMNFKRPQNLGSYYEEELIRWYLAQCSDAVLIDIADQLDLARPASGLAAQLGDSKYWLIDHLRVFISHVHTVRDAAGNLRLALQKYGISAFVAHDDIEPSDEWREQILTSLMSMDALVAILTSDFGSSKWTDQELGVAVARDVLIVPVSKGAVPYGFIEKYQSFNGEGRSVRVVAEAVFRTISTNPRTIEKMIECLAATISSSGDVEEAIFRVGKLQSIDKVPDEQWERIRENVAANAMLRDSELFIDALNAVLVARGIEMIEPGSAKQQPTLDDEIPF